MLLVHTRSGVDVSVHFPEAKIEERKGYSPAGFLDRFIDSAGSYETILDANLRKI